MELIPSTTMEPILLKLFYTDPKYCTILASQFERQWFTNHDLGQMVEVIIKYFGKYMKLPSIKTIELIAVKTFPDRKTEILSDIRAADSIDLNKYDQAYLDEEVMVYLRNNGLAWTILDNVDEVEKTNSVQKMLDKMQFLTSMSFDVDLGLDLLEDIENHIKEVTKEESRLPTFWDSVDTVMNGGLYQDGRCFAVFLGQTHVGKSLMLSNLATHIIEHNKFALIITLEMAETIYATRVDAHFTKHNINKIKYHTDDLLGKVTELKAENPNSKLVIKEFPPDTISCSHIKNYIDKLIAATGRTPDIILIDYINLLIPEGNGAGDNSYNKYRTVATEMRRLSYIFKRPVVSVTQMNRGGFGSTDPSLDDTSDSMGIPMVADFVGGLYQNDGDRNAGIMNMAVLKNRLGGMIGKKIQFSIDYENLTIKDIQTQTQAPDDVINNVLTELGVDNL